MKIKKRSSEFRGKNWCAKAREYDELRLETVKKAYYDNAIIVKEIIKGYLKGEYLVEDFPDLVSQGVEDDYLTEKSGEARRNQLVKCLERACLCEHRKAEFPPVKELEFEDYIVSVKPDAVFYNADSIELVLYRAGKPDVTQRGDKRDNSAGKCLELYFLLQYGRSLIPEGETRLIKANYYFLRKSTDKSSVTASSWDPDFFSGKGGNIVGIQDVYTGGDNCLGSLDAQYLKLLEEYSVGQECSEEECKKCQWNTVCNYAELPKLYEEKNNTLKRGRIIPTAAQQEIIRFRKGICRVNAAAGSGKTECMTERGVEMFEEGIKPSEVLFITFTDAGANEMKTRIEKKCKARNIPIKVSEIQAMTFNTFAYRIVKANYKECGFTKSPLVIDDVRNSVIITDLLNEHPVLGLDYLNYTMSMPNCYGALACTKRVFDTIKSNCISPDAPGAESLVIASLQESGILRFMEGSAIGELLTLYKTYDKRLKADNLLQFADQEPLMLRILDLHPGYLAHFGFKHIIVDEFQDSNETQLELISRLTACDCFESLMVVGDDSQSIYGFRHTSPENILHFYEKLGKEGNDLYLVENRRSTPDIINLANNINLLNEEKIDKNMVAVRNHGLLPIVNGFHSKQEEYGYIAERMKELIEKGYHPEEIAFIAYKKTELVAMGAELTRMGIPWVMMNPLPYMENSNVKAAMALAEAFYQPEASQLYFDYLIALYHGNIFSQMTVPEIQGEVQGLKKQFLNIDLFSIETQRAIFHDYLEALGEEDEIYRSFLELIYNNEDLQAELEYIRNFSIYGERASKKMEQKYQGVVLTTAHSSKGLEWKVVFNSITNYDDKVLHGGGIKSKARVEEVRRLLFVSITRARDLLYITGQYVAYGKKDDRTYNQFLIEVYEALGKEFCPIDPLEAEKTIEMKRKAMDRKKRYSNQPETMTTEEKIKYASMISNAEQLSLSDIKVS